MFGSYRRFAVLVTLVSFAGCFPSRPSTPPSLSEPAQACPATAEAILGLYPNISYADLTTLNTGTVVVAFKQRRQIAVYSQGTLSNSAHEPSCWKIALADGYPSGHKQREGDRKTPEGVYALSDKPWSSFYGAIAVHYPNEADANAGLAAGEIDEQTATTIRTAIQRNEKPEQTTALGGEILIHGGGSQSDWTLGCLAMDNTDLDTLRTLLPDGISGNIVILP